MAIHRLVGVGVCRAVFLDDVSKAAGSTHAAHVQCTARGGGGGAKKFAVSPFFRTPPPLGGVRPEKKYPTPMCKKVSQPEFFLKNTTSCFFILCKRSLHKALRTPNIPYFAGTNLVPLHILVGPKFSHHKARVLAVGPQGIWLGVKLVKMTLLF